MCILNSSQGRLPFEASAQMIRMPKVRLHPMHGASLAMDLQALEFDKGLLVAAYEYGLSTLLTLHCVCGSVEDPHGLAGLATHTTTTPLPDF